MMNPDLIQELPKLNYCEQGNKIFVKPGVYPLSCLLYTSDAADE